MPRQDEIELQELCKVTGTRPRNLVDWRNAGLGIPEPRLVSLGRGGTKSYLPRDTVWLVNRINDLRRQHPRKLDLWLWRLWIEEDFPTDIRSWVLRLIPAGEAQPGLDSASLEKSTSLRSPLGRQLSQRVRQLLDLTMLLDNVRAVLAGTARLGDLYATAEPPVLDISLKVTGLPTVNAPGDDLIAALNRIDLSWSGLAAAVNTADDAEFERSRRCLRLVTKLITTVENSDYVAREAVIRRLESGKREPHSIRARKAQRKRPPAPPKLIATLDLLWNEPVACAVILAGLMELCNEPFCWKIISDALAMFASFLDASDRQPRSGGRSDVGE
jgi:hypothetical protein